ncbi:sensor histidine kinase [Kineosporia succinea]|uniref:histidine kinase n=1 Tax=Kineosporia succinea TaxID=84632 RepID=A0ABT9PEF3_9ACTN|nr:ATP-binding protein [Kineosporia succinea]MDP9830774.1 two-component system OmpR family sensor kinase [Kineosporia succinea]
MRARIVLAVLVTVALVLVCGAVATAWSVSAYLDDRVAGRLHTVHDQIERVVALNVANQGSLKVGTPQLESLLGDRTGLILVVGGEPGFSTGLPGVSERELMDATLPDPGTVVFLDDGEPTAGIAVDTPGLRADLGGPTRIDAVVLAVSRADDRETVNRLVRTGLLVALLALGVLCVLIAAVVRAGLRPLTDLASAVQRVGRGEGGPETVPLGGSTETDQVATAVREAFRARDRAEDRLRSFVADASHELRTPLTKIGGWVDLYLQGGLRGEEGTQAALEKVEVEVGRMGMLVEELSLLARLDAQVPLDLEDVDLVALAEEVLEDARVVAADRVFTLQRPGDVLAGDVLAGGGSGGGSVGGSGGGSGGGSAVVRGDAERLRRVLRNLVGNAVQHTPAGTAVEVAVVPVQSGEDGAVRVSVRDHGLGVPAEQVPRLFERFWRAEESRSRARGGSGLGLAIVEAVVVAHGGSVAVESRRSGDPAASSGSSGEGPGTTVIFTVPGSAPSPG